MKKSQLTLVTACAAALLLSAFAVTVASLLLEGGVPSLGSPKWQPLSGRLSLVFVGALIHAVIFGIPTLLWVRQKSRVTLFSCAAYGFAIGALPLGFFSFLSQFGLQSASTNGIPTVINHFPTFFGLWELSKFVALLGLGGLVGGCGFWLGLWAAAALPAINRIPGNPLFVEFRTVAILVASVSAATAVMHFIPIAAEDRSCHNVFRDGRREISPVINMNLNVPQSEWRDVREFFRRFSAAHKLFFQDGEDVSGVGLPDSLALDLCNDQGTNISVTMYNQMEEGPGPVRGLPIEIYLFRDNTGWRSIARDFVAAMEQSWPGKLRFQDGQSRTVPRPKILDQK